MVGIQKEKNKRGNYKKPTPEDKEQIIFEYINGTSSASELSRRYGIPISTIKSYLKAKDRIYTALMQSVSDRLYFTVYMWFQTLNEMKDDKERKKLIRRYIVNEELFQYKDTNPFKNQIPPTKIFSKKSRIIQKVIDKAISHFNDLQRQGMVFLNQIEQKIDDPIYNTLQIEQEIQNTVQDDISIEQSQQNQEDLILAQQNLTIQLSDEYYFYFSECQAFQNDFQFQNFQI
ncbi:unnamed protein product [Paramecium sonneborni]|uniref:HTH psq-type domain-containing protein n=1 Tax=Paramecium sonneborni TaxID=65129 RepID=A0A8S1KLX9_9CILI|nr:unnamed protein product [Paramecium sonneborni]CAD8055181.1 unnamed protein product [Paramecium sonneborni]